jgi:hypothetical protein
VEQYLILPEATPNSDPSWFGFPIAVREDAPFRREDLIRLFARWMLAKSEHAFSSAAIFCDSLPIRIASIALWEICATLIL